MKKLVTLVTVFLLSLTMLCACTPKEKTKAEIQADLAMHSEFYHTQEVEIKSLEVIKRQTNAEENSDLIWVNVSAENEDITFQGSYCMQYGLYNEGWKLDRVTKTSDVPHNVTPKKGPEQELADAIVVEWSDSWEWSFVGKEEDLENGTCSFFYDGTMDYTTKTVIEKNCEVVFRFSQDSTQWVCTNKNWGDISRVWKLEGKWQGYKKERTYVLDFTWIEGDTFHVDLYCEGELLLSNDINFWTYDYITFKRKGITDFIYVDTDVSIMSYTAATSEYCYFQKVE